jgi:hypothetical protein
LSLLAVAAALSAFVGYDLKLVAAFWSLAVGVTFNIADLAQIRISEYGATYPEISAWSLFILAAGGFALALLGLASARRSPSVL